MMHIISTDTFAPDSGVPAEPDSIIDTHFYHENAK